MVPRQTARTHCVRHSWPLVYGWDRGRDAEKFFCRRAHVRVFVRVRACVSPWHGSIPGKSKWNLSCVDACAAGLIGRPPLWADALSTFLTLFFWGGGVGGLSWWEAWIWEGLHEEDNVSGDETTVFLHVHSVLSDCAALTFAGQTMRRDPRQAVFTDVAEGGPCVGAGVPVVHPWEMFHVELSRLTNERERKKDLMHNLPILSVITGMCS